MVSSTEVAIGKGAADSCGDVLLLGDHALVRGVDGHEPKGVPQSPLSSPTDVKLLWQGLR